MFTRIVVPLDGSDIAEQALAPAVDLARRLGIHLHLIRITEIPRSSNSAIFGFMGDESAMGEQVQSDVALAIEYLAENVRSLTEQGLVATSQVDIGLPARAIIAAANPGDCIVMSSHGRSGLAHWYFGSVAEQVMRHATVPVMVIRNEANESASSEPSQISFAS